MSVTVDVEIAHSLSQYTAGKRVLTVEASNPREALERVLTLHPDLREILLNESGKVRAGGIKLFLNSQQLDMVPGGLEATLEAGDELVVLAPISGGLGGHRRT